MRELLHHSDPSVRYLALRDFSRCAPGAPELRRARAAVCQSPPVRAILQAQYPAGFWMHPDIGVAPHFRATVWQVLFLAQFGVGRVPAVERAVTFLLAHNRDAAGAFRLRRGRQGRSVGLTCALLWALARLGFADDARLDTTWAWLLTRSHVPLNAATATWVLRAAAAWQRASPWPDAARALRPALVAGEHAPLTFPLALQVDRLAALEAWVEAGESTLPAPARAWLLEKRDARGFWPLERIPGRLWHTVGEIGAPNPWVTLRALKVLNATGAVT